MVVTPPSHCFHASDALCCCLCPPSPKTKHSSEGSLIESDRTALVEGRSWLISLGMASWLLRRKLFEISRAVEDRDDEEREASEAAGGWPREDEDEEAAHSATVDDLHHDLDFESHAPLHPEPEDLSSSEAPESSLEPSPAATVDDDPQERLMDRSPATAVVVFEWATPEPLLEPFSVKPHNLRSARKRRGDARDSAGSICRVLDVVDFAWEDHVAAMEALGASNREALIPQYDEMIKKSEEEFRWRLDRDRRRYRLQNFYN